MRRQGIAAITMAAFAAALLADISRGESRWRDLSLQRILRKRGPRRARHVVAAIEQPEAVVGQAMIAAAIASRRHARVATCILLAPLAALAVTSVVKRAFDRPRPLSHLFRKHGLESFPSSHTAGKTALVWMLAIGFPAAKKTRLSLAALAALDVVGIAAARIADGAHWPTDTIGGAAIGIATAEAVAVFAGCPRGD